MPTITQATLQQAIDKEALLTLQQKSDWMEQIQQGNPVLFDSVAIQRELGHDPEHIQVLFDMLLTIFIAIELQGLKLTTISQQSYLSELHKFSQQLAFNRDLNKEQYQQTMQHYHDTHKEPQLLLWAQQTMTESGFADMGRDESKQLTLAGITMVNCVADALSD